MTQHKHCDLIVAWANGAEIEKCVGPDEWWDDKNPEWHPRVSYRIKPQPDFNQTMDVYINKMYNHYPDGFIERRLMIDNFALLGTMNLTFDGTTGRLKSAEVL